MEWEKWTSLVLAALAELGCKGYAPPFAVPREQGAVGGLETVEPPIIRMLCELEQDGHVVFDEPEGVFRITDQGEEYRANIFQYPE